MGGRPDRHGESSPRPPRSGARRPPNRRSTIRSNRLALFRPYRCNRNLEPYRNRPRGPRHHLPGLPPSETPPRRRFRSVNRRPLHDKKSSSSRGDWSPRYSNRLRSPANGCRPARLTAFPSASRPICGRTCGSLALRVGKSPQTLGNTSNPVDGGRSWVHPASTPNTARGSGTGEPASRMGQELRLRSQEEGRDPGEAPKACSGRTATTLGPKGTSGSATGTRVSRSDGAASSLRARHRTVRTKPRPGPGHRRSSRR